MRVKEGLEEEGQDSPLRPMQVSSSPIAGNEMSLV